jgi:hypothetical protein
MSTGCGESGARSTFGHRTRGVQQLGGGFGIEARAEGSVSQVSTGDAEMFADLAMQLHGQASVADTVERVVQFAVQAVGCSEAASRWRHDGRQRDIV